MSGVWTAKGTAVSGGGLPTVATTQAAKRAAATAEQANFGNGATGDVSVTDAQMDAKAAA